MSGGRGRVVGYGHWIGAALNPSGSVQRISVALPESPGFFQYVCHPGSIARWRATVNGVPGSTETTSDLSSARVCFDEPTEAAWAVTATSIVTGSKNARIFTEPGYPERDIAATRIINTWGSRSRSGRPFRCGL
jgi:hypothetical protein